MSANLFSGHILTRVAAEAIPEHVQVNISASGVSIADDGDKVDGISTIAAASGAPVSYAIDGDGVLKVDGSGSAIVPGDSLKPGAGNDGVGIKASATNPRGAVANGSSSANGDVINVTIIPRTAAD